MLFKPYGPENPEVENYRAILHPDSDEALAKQALQLLTALPDEAEISSTRPRSAVELVADLRAAKREAADGVVYSQEEVVTLTKKWRGE